MMNDPLTPERLDAIWATLTHLHDRGFRMEDIRVERDALGYGVWCATLGEYDLGCKVGTGSTADAAIEDLLDQLTE